MALNINGTTGISGVDGSASAPAVTGTDSNTGINFASDTVNINTGGTTRATVDSSGRLLLGTTTEGQGSADDLTIATTGSTGMTIRSGTSDTGSVFFSDGTSGADEYRGYVQYEHNNNALTFGTDGSERMRIDSSGHFLFSCTSPLDATDTGIKLFNSDVIPYITNTIDTNSTGSSFYHLYNKNASNNGYRFYVLQNGGIANHSGNNSNLSDEREKKNITPMGSVYSIFKQFVFKDFNYISEADSVPKKHGVIAQDVESIDSDLITEDFKTSIDSEGNDVLRKGLKEEQFMMIGLKTLQETITKLEAAEAKIEILETKVAALEAG